MRGWRLMLAMCALAVAGATTAHARALIVGGSNAPPGSWPALVALVEPLPATPSQSQFCGGTLVDVQVVLTAGHCVDDGVGGVVGPGTFDVLVGVTDLGAQPGTYQRIGVSAINRHPSFNGTTIENDVAMLHLATPATLGPTAQVMDLVPPTDRAQWQAGDPAQIAGWGRTNAPPAPATFTDALQQADVQIVADSSCSSGASYGSIFVPAVMVCAGVPTGGVDACNGDSGGSLVVPDLNGRKVLVGATSFTSPANPCGHPNFPAVYTRLDALRSFVYGAQGVSGVSPPGAPTAVAGTRVPGGANVSWTAPATSGGRTIAGYRIMTRVNGNPVSTVDVPATSPSAIVTGLTCGTTYTFTVTAANAVGLGAVSGPSSPLPANTSSPSNTALPVVTGTAGVGRTLTASTGQWVSCPETFTYQWLVERVAGSGTFEVIAGQTGSQYVVAPSDAGARIRVRVTAMNGVGGASADSAATAVVPPAPRNLAPPVAAGLGRVGTPLTATAGSWNVTDGLAFQWQRETPPGSAAFVPIPGATGVSYLLTAADVRARLAVTVTATNASGSATMTSNAIAALPPFRVTSLRAPKVTVTPSGVAVVALRLQTEAHARLAIRVIDNRGRLRSPIAASSRIAGHTPRVVSQRLTAQAGAGTISAVTVAFHGRSQGTLRTIRIVILATNGRGERTETTVRTRVSL